MNAKAKSNSVITSTFDVASRSLKFTVLGVGDLVLDMAKVNAAIVDRAAVHGLTQRISDRAAKPRDQATGQAQSPQEKYDAMAELVEHYNSGSAEWSLARTGGGGRDSMLVRALIELKPSLAADDIREYVKTLSAGAKAALMAEPKISKIVKRIEAEAIKSAGIDAGDLLAQLEGFKPAE